MSGPRKGQFGVTATGGFVAAGIRVVTRRPVNHTIFCVDDDGTCVEGDPKGAQVTHAGNYPNAIWSDLPLTDEQAEGAAVWANAHIGTPYSWRNCVYIAFVDLFGWAPKFMRDRLASCDDLMCSQLADAALALGAHYQLFVDERPFGGVSPGDEYDVIKAGHPL